MTPQIFLYSPLGNGSVDIERAWGSGSESLAAFVHEYIVDIAKAVFLWGMLYQTRSHPALSPDQPIVEIFRHRDDPEPEVVWRVADFIPNDASLRNGF